MEKQAIGPFFAIRRSKRSPGFWKISRNGWLGAAPN
jgi:hypothetical protein